MAPSPRPRVDTSAPLLHVEHVLKTGKLVGDIERLRTVACENRELLKKINQICRSRGFLNVNYSYRVHQSLNSEARTRSARLVECENRKLLDRLLRKQAAVHSNLRQCGKIDAYFSGSAENPHQLTIDFWERTDRWLCQLNVTLQEKPCEENRAGWKRGNIFRIFRDTCLVLRSQPISQDEEVTGRGENVLRDVAKGCLVRQRHASKEHLLLTLRKIGTISGATLLGRVDPGSFDKLDVLNYYGSKFGRCLEPLTYHVTFGKT
ncbi:uncharacterized protein LOC131294586 [Anopheles ziemanni]|uniref:uncharacterized protein LOC131265204 n=1 Tax=Anopheles coustani TaxID=139045 RepID=UPI00265A7B67|nr:uncharacterized protein LOC131265204 [Anopheles coustani]XP_058178614.1 uncharacterized protein LOC131294586 [Anopheles ziemanni]